MEIIRRKKNISKEDELLDLQLKQQKLILKQMARDNKKERMQKITNVVKRTGNFAMRSISPKEELSREEIDKRMFGFPDRMFGVPNSISNSSSRRGKKIQYIRRVR